MAGTVGPQLEGSITIPTQEFSKAVTEFVKGATRMSKAMESLSKNMRGTDKALKETVKDYNRSGKAAKQAGDTQAKAAQKVSDLEQRKSNVIARAANRIYNMEQAVKRSNTSHEQQSAVIARIRRSFQQYSDAVNRGSMTAREMDNANTRLGTSIGAANRQLREYSKTKETSQRQDVANIKSQNALEVSYNRTTNAIQQSQLTEKEKEAAVARLLQQYRASTKAIQEYGGRHVKGAQAIAQFRTEASKANTQVRNVNASARKRDLESWRNQMRDVSSSVQLALGPLSGVASRVMALTALFSRNAAVVAGFIAGLTGLGVAFTKSFRAGVQAETQLLRLEGVVSGLGDQAVMTGQEIFDMGTQIGLSFLTTAKEARDAAGVLATFGAVGRDQFQEVLETAQGLATVTGRDLKSTTRDLARLLQDPAKNFEVLSRNTRAFSEDAKDSILQMRAQGNVAEANAKILEHFGYAQEAAKKEAELLAGSLDTTGELFGIMYENLFATSGASDEATKRLTEFNEKLQEFGESEAIERLGDLFRNVTIAIGESLLFLANNIQVVSAAFAGIAAATGVRFVAWLAKVSGLLSIVKMRFAGAAATSAVYDTATKRATASTRTFSTVLKAIPWVAVISLVTAVVAGFMAFGKEAKEASEKSSEAIEGTLRKIRRMPGLTDESKEAFQDLGTQIQASMRDVEEDLDSVIDKMTTLGKIQTQNLARPAASTMGAGGGVSVTNKLTEQQQQANRQLTFEVIKLTGEQFKLQLEMGKLNAERQRAIDLAQEEANRNQEMGFAISDAADQVKELRKEFDRESVQMEELESKHKAAIALRDNLTKNMFALTEAEKAHVTMLNGTIIPAIKEQMRSLGESEDQVGRNSRAYSSLVSAMKDASSEIRILKMEMSGASDMEIASFTANEEMNKELNRMSVAIGNLKDHELPGFAKELGVSLDGLSGRTARVNALTEAFNKQHGQLLETRTSMELYAQAWNEARDIMEGTQTGIAAINTEYQNQRQVLEPLLDMWMNENLSMEQRTAAAHRYSNALSSLNEQQKRQTEEAMRTAGDAAQMNPMSEMEQLKKDYENRRRIILEQYDWEDEAAKGHLDELEKQFNRQNTFLKYGEYAETGLSMVEGAMQSMTNAGREESKKYQKLAIGQALIQQGQAVANIWAAPGGNLATKLAESAVAAFQVGTQIKQIRSQSFSTGGAVQGPGTRTSDSIPAWLSNGEFVMSAGAVQKIGMRNLEAMNDGQMPKFADGGMPKFSSVNKSGGNTSNGNIEFVVINNSSSVEVEQSEQTDGDGNRRLVATITDVVNSGMNNGTFDRTMGRNFGVSRQGRGR